MFYSNKIRSKNLTDLNNIQRETCKQRNAQQVVRNSSWMYYSYNERLKAMEAMKGDYTLSCEQNKDNVRQNKILEKEIGLV